MIDLNGEFLVRLDQIAAVGPVMTSIGKNGRKMFAVYLLGGQSLTIRGTDEALHDMRKRLTNRLKSRQRALGRHPHAVDDASN